MTREGIKPQEEKVQALLKVQRPTRLKHLRRYLGMVNFYRRMWAHRAHILTPITNFNKKTTKYKWTEDCQCAFKEIQRIIAAETLLAYPDYKKPFDIHTDASDYQLGGVISQNRKPIAFYSRKLTQTQKNYTVTEKELLSAVEILKEYKTMVYGYKINLYTDHKNLCHQHTVHTSQRVNRQRLLLDEYQVIIHYLPGEHNVTADYMSLQPTDQTNTNKVHYYTGAL